MAQHVISLEKAKRPAISDAQVAFCKELIGMGLSRLAITGLILQKDVARLTSSDINAGHRTINKSIAELGYSIIDARNARSPFMQGAIKSAATRMSFSVKLKTA
jgi:methyl coenzyme M reductase subunit C